MEREKIGVFDVKTHFSEIVDRVLKDGRTITVTRRGEPVVEISPCQKKVASGRMTKGEALKAFDELRARLPKMKRDEIVELVHEGRKPCPNS
ncbi:MAG: type II toxin-antitoxin system prevent-host-death family antitoxin [Planctomycetota bacterium]